MVAAEAVEAVAPEPGPGPVARPAVPLADEAVGLSVDSKVFPSYLSSPPPPAEATEPFFGLPRPFKLPSPLGKSVAGPSSTILIKPTVAADGLAGFAGGLTGETAVELLICEEGADEEFSFRVSFNFLGGAAGSGEGESLML